MVVKMILQTFCYHDRGFQSPRQKFLALPNTTLRFHTTGGATEKVGGR